MDETIQVGYRTIGSAMGQDYHHKFLLYTDSSGRQHTISGWTGKEAPGLPYGRIHVEVDRPYNASNPDHRDNANAKGQAQYRESITSGKDLSDVWARMVANAKAMDGKYPYDPMTQNSNTLADAVLRSVRLREPVQDGFSQHWAPASGKQLDATVKPQVPGLGNSGRAFSANDGVDLPVREAQLRDDPLFRQALAGLDRLGPDAGVYRGLEEKERIAAALALQARLHQPPLPEIQDVRASQVNGNVFAIWRNPDNAADQLRPHVDRQHAATQPLHETLMALQGATERQPLLQLGNPMDRQADDPSPRQLPRLG